MNRVYTSCFEQLCNITFRLGHIVFPVTTSHIHYTYNYYIKIYNYLVDVEYKNN